MASEANDTSETHKDLRQGSPDVRRVFAAALPVMLGYLSIGLPCGILGAQAGLEPWMCFVMSVTFYTGAGQFMLPNLWMAGATYQAILGAISLVNTRQMLYAASFSQIFTKASFPVSLAFSATVTDESFGVNTEHFEEDPSWKYTEALILNVMCMLSWACANFLGAYVGNLLNIPTALAGFAMTSIFICLLLCQHFDKPVLVCVLTSFTGVYLAKLAGLGGAAIMIGALVGIVCGMLAKRGASWHR